MNGQRRHWRALVGRAMTGLVGTAATTVATTMVTALLLAPTAAASPIGDAEAAIMAAWEKAGGDGSTLGARKGDVYPIGDGFALDFSNGKMFYTTDTGAKLLYGPILDKYESLGGPAGSDLGFPTINETAGLAGPDTRVSTFSASDKPVIYWTPEHGAFAVRGAINSAWDKLGSSGGVLGVPVGDESYDGETTSQKFSGGELSWNRQTKQFTTVPSTLADQLSGLQVTIDPTAAINAAWRASGGATGPLGAKQGGQSPVGSDGVAQPFAGGKIFYSPSTGAGAVESDILAKYESLGGPLGSNLGFPTGNEADGGFGSSSRVSTFSSGDKIFWTPDHGAFAVRGAMRVAWDKLRGPVGKLGAPAADQTTDGDVISQKFTGGKIFWDRAKNAFSTEPANLTPLLSGLQVPGQNQPSGSGTFSYSKKFTWHWWWLLAAIPLLLLLVLLGFVAFGRRSPKEAALYRADQEPDHGDNGYEGYEGHEGYESHEGYEGYEGGYMADHGPAADEDWDEDREARRSPAGDRYLLEGTAADDEAATRVSWRRGAGTAAGLAGAAAAGEGHGNDLVPSVDEHFEEYEDADLEAADTTPIALESVLRSVAAAPGAFAEFVPDIVEAELVVPESPDSLAPEVPETVHTLEPEAPEAVGPDVALPDDDASEIVAEVVETEIPVRGGRHAAAHAVDDEDDWNAAVAVPESEAQATPPRHGGPGRPMLCLPLEDPYLAPDGYPIKGNASFGLYYTPGTVLYHDTIADIWFASEEVALANGFTRAD